MAEEKKAAVAKAKAAKAPKVADPVQASIDPATQQMIARARNSGSIRCSTAR